MAATRSRGTRRLAVIVLAIVAVIGAIAVAVPFLISSDAVKKRITDQITHWTGRPFSFVGDAKLRLFPYLTVRLQDVRLSNPAGMENGPFIYAEQMTGKLEILPLFLGRLEFAEFRLAEPRIKLMVDEGGHPNWILDQGVVGTLASKGDSELPADDPSPPSPRADVGLGRFLIRGGTVNYSDARNGISESLTEVNVDLNWESTVEAASGKGTFTWRDQPVRFTGEINAPLTLLAGGDSPLRVDIEAAPANVAFDGVARQFDGMQLEGRTRIEAPSVADLAAWLGLPLGARAPIGAASIAGDLSWVAATLNFNNARVDVDGNVGEGALTATLANGRPSIQATLDFARFDFAPPVAALSAALDPDGAWRDLPIDLPIVRAANLDLRLSAGQAIAGSMAVGPLAASVLVQDGELLAEVNEAHIGTGAIEASVRAKPADGGLSVAAELKGDDLAVETIGGLLGVSAVSGTGEASARLAGTGSTWGELAGGLSGTVGLSLAAGTVAGIDVKRLPAALAEAGASPLGGSTPYDRITTNLTVAGGLIATDDFRAEGPGYTLDVAGKVALAAETVEARGVLTQIGEAPGIVPFLAVGPWASPAFQPDLGAPLPRDSSGAIEIGPGNG